MANDELALAPHDVAKIANNVYFTLGGWAQHTADKAAGVPSAERAALGGQESRDVVEEKVGGGGDLGDVFTGKSGWMAQVSSGFGYLMTKNGGDDVIVATRGTRPEMSGKPDLMTDLRFTPSACFMDVGPIHKGFYDTFHSFKGSLEARADVFTGAKRIHCVGHSLGGALANLTAYFLKKAHGKDTRLYTFGAPRVGMFALYPHKITSEIGTDSIYRVSHNMDPITMIPIFPFQHVLESDRNDNNILLRSPASGPSMANHSMETYSRECEGESWSSLRGQTIYASFEDRLWAKWWKQDTGWINKGGKLVVAGATWLLMKLLRAVAKLIGGAIVTFVATPLDLLGQLIYKGVKKTVDAAKGLFRILQMCARAAGIALDTAKDVSVVIINHVLSYLGRAVRSAGEAALHALESYGRMARPMTMWGFGPMMPM